MSKIQNPFGILKKDHQKMTCDENALILNFLLKILLR